MRQDVVEDGHDPRREQKASPVFPKDPRQDPKDPNLLFLASLGLLRAVHLDHVLLRDLLVDQELRDEFPLVALELNDVAELGVIYDGAVAVELLLALLQDDLLVDLGVDPLHGREGLAAVPLLGADVNVPALHGVGLLRLLRGRSVVVGEIEIGS